MPCIAERRVVGDAIAAVAQRVRTVVLGHPEIKTLYLFGSRARGDFTDASDYDFYVEFDYDKLTWTGYASLIAELEAALDASIDLVSGADIATRSPILWLEIARDGVLLYEREAD